MKLTLESPSPSLRHWPLFSSDPLTYDSFHLALSIYEGIFLIFAFLSQKSLQIILSNEVHERVSLIENTVTIMFNKKITHLLKTHCNI